MTFFDDSVLSRDSSDRSRLLGWLGAAIKAIDPEELTASALRGLESGTAVVAIGKAAPAMCRGAARVTPDIRGLCISDHEEEVPTGFDLILGDHPIPGPASIEAARAAFEFVSSVDGPLIGLISGGGSSLCEAPKDGVPQTFVEEVNHTLIQGGASIGELNVVRGLISSVKCGGLARAAGRPIDTYVISDVAGADPAIVSSGPTVPSSPDQKRGLETLARFGVEVSPGIRDAILNEPEPGHAPKVTLIADGYDAAHAVAGASTVETEVRSDWLGGEVEACVDAFLSRSSKPLTVAVGEPVLRVSGDGRGGRNTHAALIAAERLGGTNSLFAAFATDGVDGQSGSAGALVDGYTFAMGDDPTSALAGFDSASYLESTGDLLVCQPTGTNVSDIWVLWRRIDSGNVEL